MNFYLKPHISTMKYGPFISQSQYIPECEGQPCGRGQLGLVCDDEGNAATVTFFVQGNQNPPPCQLIINDPIEPTNQPINCVFNGPLASCNEGAVWQITCDFTDNDPCDNGAEVFISCDGEQVPCDPLINGTLG